MTHKFAILAAALIFGAQLTAEEIATSSKEATEEAQLLKKAAPKQELVDQDNADEAVEDAECEECQK